MGTAKDILSVVIHRLHNSRTAKGSGTSLNTKSVLKDNDGKCRSMTKEFDQLVSIMRTSLSVLKTLWQKKV